MRHITIILKAVVVFLLVSSLSAQEIEYEVVQIPGLLGAVCLNDNAVVIGTTPDNTAWMWESGTITYLPGLGYEIHAININNSSVIVGLVKDATMNGYHACAWYNGTLSVLSGYPCCIEWYAGDINSSGTIIGGVSDSANGWRAYPYIYSGSMQILYDLEDYSFHGINDGNIIAATAWSGETGRACLYNNGSVTFLSAPGSNTNAYDINNFGHVLGSDESIGFCLWKDGTQIPVGLQCEGEGRGLNDFDVVVGYVESGGQEYAAVWDNGTTRYLDYLINPDLGLHLVFGCDINNNGEILCIGSDGFAYLLLPYSAIVIYDAKNDTIPDVTFNLIKVANDGPLFTEDTLGSITTDSLGRLELTETAPDTFSVELEIGTAQLVAGDIIKIAKHVHDEPAMKHPVLMPTMYSVHLDNAIFDEDGIMSFDTLTSGIQEFYLDHTEFRFNLMVAVEWDAEAEYLSSIENGFGNLSNYLYDVTDGHVRIDTVMIHDNQNHWLESDIRIWTNNTLWPNGSIGGIQVSSLGDVVNMPRKWYGNVDDSRNGSYTEGSNIDFATSNNFRQLAHELGHYLFAFDEEYEFVDLLGHCDAIDNYGFMEYLYDDGGIYASEMSNLECYTFMECQNTYQYHRFNQSCWEQFETDFESQFGADSILAEVWTPAEGDLVPFVGPNDDLNNPDYDVGSKVIFPVDVVGPSAFTLDVVTHDLMLNPLPGVDVVLRKPGVGGSWTDIYQGKSCDLDIGMTPGGGIYVLAAETGDQILASTPHTVTGIAKRVSPYAASSFNWLVGEATVGGASDAIGLTLSPIEGAFPLVIRPVINNDTVDLALDFETAFSEVPTLELSGSSQSYSFQQNGNSYTTQITSAVDSLGTMTVWAKDTTGTPYFFRLSYVVHEYDSTLAGQLIGPNGKCGLRLDTAVVAPHSAMIIASPYPVLRNGLTAETVQVGNTYGLSLDSSVTGSHMLTIRYDDIDLVEGVNQTANESSLVIHHWDESSMSWVSLGGVIDTLVSQVQTMVPGSGVYALFTDDIVTGIDDDNSSYTMPYHFRLLQNYPNPFNPATTIEYSVPSRSRVTIEVYNIVGQKVRTLIDETKSVGEYQVSWDGRSRTGQQVSTGVYFYRFQADDHVETKKMLLLK